MATRPSVNPFAREARPTGLRRWVPGLSVLGAYQRSWIARDIGAGLVLTSILVPVGMGYAEAAGLPAINGLYATIVPLLAYALFGPSRILVLGPDSALAALIAATVLPLAAGDAVKATGLASALAVLSGALCVGAGIARLGFVTDLLSKPIRYGYLNGIALTVLAGQLPKVFGFNVSGDTLLAEAAGVVWGVADGRTNPTACLVGLGCLALILVFRRWMPRVPAMLIAVVSATVVEGLFDLSAQARLSVVGPMPQGLPTMELPPLSAGNIGALFGGAVAVALVSFADMSVLSRTFALRNRYEADPNQELVALGAANLAAGLFQGFSVSSSASRTPVVETAGARTQVAGIVGAVCVGLLLVYAPALLANLPHAALGAVVIAACLSLVEVAGVRRLYRLRPGEFVLSIVCFLGVALVGVVQGIFISVGLALMALVWRAWHPYHAVLGRVDGLKGYHDISRHPEGRRIPGLVLFRWDAQLFFANAEVFHDHVRAAVASAPTKTRWVVVAAEPVTDVDLTAADMLFDLDEDLRREGIDLCFAEMKGPVKDRLNRYGLFDQIGRESFFPTVGQAVDSYLDATGVAWTDWDETAGAPKDPPAGPAADGGPTTRSA